MAMSELLKKTVLVGIGAAAEVADRSKDLTDSLAKKGQDTINKGRAMNEELKRKAREDLLEHVENMTEEERNIFKKTLSEASPVPLEAGTLEKMAGFCDLLFEKNKVMNLTAVKTPQAAAILHFADSLYYQET